MLSKILCSEYLSVIIVETSVLTATVDCCIKHRTGTYINQFRANVVFFSCFPVLRNIWDHPFSMKAKIFKKLTFPTL